MQEQVNEGNENDEKQNRKWNSEIDNEIRSSNGKEASKADREALTKKPQSSNLQQTFTADQILNQSNV